MTRHEIKEYKVNLDLRLNILIYHKQVLIIEIKIDLTAICFLKREMKQNKNRHLVHMREEAKVNKIGILNNLNI